MSDDLYRTRLWFDGRRGVAKSEEVQVQLLKIPEIPGLPPHITEIDFAPQSRCCDIRESAQGRRAMRTPEVEAVTAWLAGIVAAVRKQIGIA